MTKQISSILSSVFVLLLVSLCPAYSQESGILFGGSYSPFSGEMTKAGSSLKIGDPKFNFHAGYQYRHSLKNKFSFDFSTLYGERSSSLKSSYQTIGKDGIKFQYLSIGGVANYEPIKNLQFGLGIEPTWYLRFQSEYVNTIDPAFDIPLVAKLNYSFKSFDISLSYKYGTCKLMRSDLVENLRSRDLQLSIYIPLFCKNR